MEDIIEGYMDELSNYQSEIEYLEISSYNKNIEALGINELANYKDSYTDILGRLKRYLTDVSKEVDKLGVENLETILSYGKRLINRITDNRFDITLEYMSKNEVIKRVENDLVLIDAEKKELQKRIKSVESVIKKLKSITTDSSFDSVILELEENVLSMRKSITEKEDEQSKLRNEQRMMVTGGDYKAVDTILNREKKEEVRETEGYIGKHLRPEETVVEEEAPTLDNPVLVNPTEEGVTFGDDDGLNDYEKKEDLFSIDKSLEGVDSSNLEEELNKEMEKLSGPILLSDGMKEESEPELVESHETPSEEETLLDVPDRIRDEERLDVPERLSDEEARNVIPDLIDDEEYPAEAEDSKPALWRKLGIVITAAAAFLGMYALGKSKSQYPNNPMDFPAETAEEEENEYNSYMREAQEEQRKIEEDRKRLEEYQQQLEKEQKELDEQRRAEEEARKKREEEEARRKAEEERKKEEERLDIRIDEGDMYLKAGEEAYDASTGIGVTADGTRRQYNEDHSYEVVDQTPLEHTSNGTTVVRNEAFEAPKESKSQNQTEEEARKNMSQNQQNDLDIKINDIDWASVFNEQNNSLGFN